ncbi:MAG: hypothetical protein JWQ27_811 [Ferruginibacter sp.]|nr:hypothetical protein [Ferruginibacter sp.]
MKRYPRNATIHSVCLAFAILFLSSSCSNNNDEAAVNQLPDSTETVQYFDKPGPAETVEAPLTWQLNYEKQTKKKNPALAQATLNANQVVTALNTAYPEIKLELRSISHDTIFTQIKDAEYFTNQMGSSGAAFYLAQAVLNLAEVKGINRVKIDFERGSHASPGVWGKEAFAEYKEVQ